MGVYAPTLSNPFVQSVESVKNALFLLFFLVGEAIRFLERRRKLTRNVYTLILSLFYFFGKKITPKRTSGFQKRVARHRL